MLNFRKLKQDFSSTILKKGKDLYEQKKVESAKILKLDEDSLRISGKVIGSFENTHESEIEIDRLESQTIHCNCDCSYQYDCQHIAALVFFLEKHLDKLLVHYSKNEDFKTEDSDLLDKIGKAISKENEKKDENYQKELIYEYAQTSNFLSTSPFFQKLEKQKVIHVIPFVLLNFNKDIVEFQLSFRLPFRSKPLHISNLEQFFQALKYEEEIILGSKSYLFSMDSFKEGKKILTILMNRSSFKIGGEKSKKIGIINLETLGEIIFEVFNEMDFDKGFSNEKVFDLPNLFIKSLENPFKASFAKAKFLFELEYLIPPMSKVLINPKIVLNKENVLLEKVIFLRSKVPGVVHNDIYYRFNDEIKRAHLKNIFKVREIIIPQALFGSFVENSLFELKRYADVANEKAINDFITLPYADEVRGKCILSYVDRELEANLYFIYDKIKVAAVAQNLSFDEMQSFITKDGILARNLVEEKKIVEDLFQDFVFNEENNHFISKSEKRIVQFMTKTILKYKDRIEFDCPQNLLDQFIYDKTTFTLNLDISSKPGYFSLNLKVNGDLKGVSIQRLWECMSSKRCYLDLGKSFKLFKILVLDLKMLSKLIQIFDEIGIEKLVDQKVEKPLWRLVSINPSVFKNLPIKFSISKNLQEIKKEMLGEKKFIPSKIPSVINATLRSYQEEGVKWLERIRTMFLGGILADDMGLGKTLQAIVSISQMKGKHVSIVVCPTSLLYNWKEEFSKFNKEMKVVVVDGIPLQRKKIISKIKNFDVAITSYTLMQKDVDLYQNVNFSYIILDEAQHIKNKNTRNAKSVKMLKGSHRLILTGTPIENSLNEIWSLFDFLMPGFLSSFDRFLEKYVKTIGEKHAENMVHLKKKVSPFILRRMKKDVLKDLPPISEITNYCKLSDVQLELYQSYAKSAKKELCKLVEKEGFEKVQIHVLATLTRLKQICCHPAIFAKEKAEIGDSAKYDMLLELLQTLVENKHKTVIFSQYTKMLKIMKEDFEHRKIKFCYLDGSTKNRLEIVKEFNEDPNISVFLVSLKAGGIGLNINKADTVIHYDMWWNPAVEMQARDRVHRIGQRKSVMCYKLVTLNSIEEKILDLQKRKKGLVKKVISCDDEAIYKLTWEDVLKFLQI